MSQRHEILLFKHFRSLLFSILFTPEHRITGKRIDPQGNRTVEHIVRFADFIVGNQSLIRRIDFVGIVQVNHFIAVISHIHSDAYHPFGSIHQTGTKTDFYAAVLQYTDITLQIRETGRCRDRHVQQRLFRTPVIPVDIQGKAIPKFQTDAGIHRLGLFRFQVFIIQGDQLQQTLVFVNIG